MAQAGASEAALSRGSSANETRSGGRPLGLRTCVPCGGCSSFRGWPSAFRGVGVKVGSPIATRELPPVLPLRAPSAPPAAPEPEPEEYPGLGVAACGLPEG